LFRFTGSDAKFDLQYLKMVQNSNKLGNSGYLIFRDLK